jgi:hypothetical protein
VARLDRASVSMTVERTKDRGRKPETVITYAPWNTNMEGLISFSLQSWLLHTIAETRSDIRRTPQAPGHVVSTTTVLGSLASVQVEAIDSDSLHFLVSR